jgi:serine/threonine protein kinase
MTEETIFAVALEKPPTERTAYLAEACGNDESLRKRLEGMLAASAKVGNFMATPAVAPALDPAATEALSRGSAHGSISQSATGPNADEELTFLAPPGRADALGRIGHYEVLQVLGKGAFGIVFRAFDDMLQRVVAVKVMAPQLAATSPARRRFLREARTSAAVRHENVVQLYEVAEQPLPYLAMEFIPGETLQQRLDRVGPLDVPETLRIGRQIAEGLAAAHATDLIHRDIKPSNVLIEGGQQRVKITDFGLARAADDASISQSGIIAGTPMYMAPEQALGHNLDQRADLFSLGSVLYQMAAGRPPFRANNTVAVLKRVADDTPRDIREIIPETPQWLCDIISKLHAKNPNDRYQSAREVADVLADCEAQLKANSKLKDFSRIPRGKSQPSGRQNWVAAAAAVLFPVFALATMEFAGVTHLFRGRQATTDPIKPGSDSIKEKPPFVAKYALKFEGKDDVVIISEDANFDLGNAITIETWVKFNVLPSVANRTMILVAKSMFRNDLDLIAQTDDRFQFFVGAGAFVRSKATIELGKWYHVAATYREGDLIEIFVNGKLESSRSIIDVRLAANSNPLTIGSASSVWPERELAGMIRGVHISRTVRYVQDFSPEARFKPDPDTIALYHFDEGQGDVLKDSSGNGHHGKIVGAKWMNGDGTPVVKQEPLPAKTPPAVAPFTDADVMRIAALPAADQVEEVRKELMRRNPGFDGQVGHKIEDSVVTELRIVTDNVTDIAPIRVFNGLRVLECRGTYTDKPNGLLADLTPLKEMNLAHLTHLDLRVTKASDAEMVYFKDCKNLKFLDLGATEVTDRGLIHFNDCKNLKILGLYGTNVGDPGLAQFKDCKNLTFLNLAGTQVSDAGLAQFKGMSLTELSIERTGITNLSSLQGMPLEVIRLTPKNITRGLDILRDMKSLKTIGILWDQAWPAAEFWERYDKGEFTK